ncbi:MAG TPA: HEAT repeat domain-containing protein [Gammaproteobacteria bacterium]
MIAKTSIGRLVIVMGLMSVSFYAGIFLSGRDFRHEQARYVASLQTRIEQLERELQTREREDRLLQSSRQTMPPLEPSANMSESGEGLLVSESETSPVSDAERLARAREDVWSDAQQDRMRAIETLIRLSPAEAVDVIRMIMSQSHDGEDVSLVVSSLRALVDNQYLLNVDLKEIYNSGDEQLQRVAADALAQRGDDSLQRRYIDEQYAIATQHTDSVRRAEAVQKLTAFGKNPQAASRILPLLEDHDSYVRLKAVSALAYAGEHSDIPAVQALLDDEVAAVRQRAEEVIGALNRSDSLGLILVPPPRMSADGAPAEYHSR